MTKEEFLTVRWNNLLSLAMGLIPLIYVIGANLYLNNVLKPEQVETFPFRA
jgi:hypothetical protein